MGPGVIRRWFLTCNGRRIGYTLEFSSPGSLRTSFRVAGATGDVARRECRRGKASRIGWTVKSSGWFESMFPKKPAKGAKVKKRSKARVKTKKKDPLFVDGQRPRPMYVDYKDVELLKKLVNRHGRIVSRRKTGCSAVSQHAVTQAIKRARFMALLPYTGE